MPSAREFPVMDAVPFSKRKTKPFVPALSAAGGMPFDQAVLHNGGRVVNDADVHAESL